MAMMLYDYPCQIHFLGISIQQTFQIARQLGPMDGTVALSSDHNQVCIGSNAMPDTTKNLFTAHPHAVGESYGQHFGVAMRYSGRLFYASFCAFVHAFLPFAYEKTASTMIRGMVADMDRRTHQPTTAPLQPAE
jgi:Family of unknown function (DUF6356)